MSISDLTRAARQLIPLRGKKGRHAQDTRTKIKAQLWAKERLAVLVDILAYDRWLDDDLFPLFNLNEVTEDAQGHYITAFSKELQLHPSQVKKALHLRELRAGATKWWQQCIDLQLLAALIS